MTHPINSVVNDKMESGYRYTVSQPVGGNFAQAQADGAKGAVTLNPRHTPAKANGGLAPFAFYTKPDIVGMVSAFRFAKARGRN